MRPEIDEVEAWQRDQKRRGRLRLLGLVAVGAALATGAVLLLGRSADAGKLDRVRQAMAQIDGSLRPGFAAAALLEVEASRIPEPMRKALQDLQAVPPDMRSLVAARVLTQPRALEVLVRACPSGPRALGAAAALAPSEQVARFCQSCAALCARVRRPAGAQLGVVIFASVLAESLARSGRIDPTEQRLLEWLVEAD